MQAPYNEKACNLRTIKNDAQNDANSSAAKQARALVRKNARGRQAALDGVDEVRVLGVGGLAPHVAIAPEALRQDASPVSGGHTSANATEHRSQRDGAGLIAQSRAATIHVKAELMSGSVKRSLSGPSFKRPIPESATVTRVAKHDIFRSAERFSLDD